MCSKTSPSPSPSSDNIQTNSVMKRIRKPNTRFSSTSYSLSSSSSSSSLKPLRRGNRTKTRKPKFVSLRLKLSKTAQPKAQQQQQQQQQQQHLNLFPLHPEMQEENNVALLFSSEGGATLNGLLEEESTTTTTTTSEGSLSAMTCPVMDGNWLVRKAMRKRERESEERWVCYSEVVEEKKVDSMEEVTSYCDNIKATTSFGLLSLKLDHEGILNAWSDKGSLYVEAPHTVPDLLLHNPLLPNVAWENSWKVPESCGTTTMNVKEEMGWKVGQREASVQRYKEKRQSRLFSKRIRYEVRKLNAEKRPRMKGRFVKRE
ncbi:hypothetical protein RJT34_08983 [Clitoria ternatea]|uniref:CCT domain-containing protein n=1 Tax=Clitoria ternatea TaxID=43366 RepID=A0AAN9PW37_CLITE